MARLGTYRDFRVNATGLDYARLYSYTQRVMVLYSCLSPWNGFRVYSGVADTFMPWRIGDGTKTGRAIYGTGLDHTVWSVCREVRSDRGFPSFVLAAHAVYLSNN